MAAAKKTTEELSIAAAAEEVKTKDPLKRVKIKLFKDNGKYKDPLYVRVNGYTALIERGVVVDVPYYVAKHIEEMLKQDEQTAQLISQLSGEFEAKKERLT